jgi:cell division protein FtsZ
MMKKADDVLLQAIKGITDLINLPGHINVDFADLRTIMQQVGPAIMGAGVAEGEKRAIEAAKKAIDNPLLQDIGIDGAQGVLINISATEDSLTMTEFMEASSLIQEKAHDNANIVVGALFDESLGNSLRVTVIATGINSADEVITAPESVVSLHSTNREDKDEQKEARRGSFVRPGQQRGKNILRRNPTLPNFLDEAELETPTYLRKAAD